MPNWKARIGILSPSVFEVPSDWNLILPRDFSLVATGLNVQTHSPEEFDRAIEALESTLSVFIAEEVDVILVGGITLATQRGYNAEQEVMSKLSKQFGLPITTGMQASVEALHYLSARKIVIATAYKESINHAVKRYYEDSGLKVLGITGHNVTKPVEQVKLPEDTSAKVGQKLIDEYPESDALLLQGRWPSVACVEQLETEVDRPVVATVAASLWWALRALAKKEPIKGYGKLLRN